MEKESSNTSRIVRGTILTRIMEYGTFTIPDIVDETGISPSTISKYVFDMQDEGVIVNIDTVKADRRGRRPVLYGLKAGSVYFVGVDIKNFSLGIGLMDLSGNLLKLVTDNDFRFVNSYSNLEDVCTAVDTFLSSLGDIRREQVAGVCFAIGGRINSRQGTSASTYNLEEFRDTPLAEFLEKRLGCRVMIENDTKVMTYGEYMELRKSEDIRDMLYVNIGWGLGLGVVIDGKLIRGHTGYAGELGHIPFYDNNVICHCGKKGCIETEVSGNAVYRKLTERIRKGESSILTQKVMKGDVITIRDMLYAAEKEDSLCVNLISSMGSELGRHIAGMINIFNPECIMIGGTFSKAAAYYFLYPMRDAIRKYSLKLISNDVKVLSSKFGDDAGVFGACMLARNTVFNELF